MFKSKVTDFVKHLNPPYDIVSLVTLLFIIPRHFLMFILNFAYSIFILKFWAHKHPLSSAYNGIIVTGFKNGIKCTLPQTFTINVQNCLYSYCFPTSFLLDWKTCLSSYCYSSYNVLSFFLSDDFYMFAFQDFLQI